MSQISNEVAFTQATEFIKQQDKTVQFWAGRFVAVQAGLAIAESALYTWNSRFIWLVPTIATLLATLSIILINTITAIIVRECKWQSLYLEMVIRTEGENPLLFQPGYKISGANIPTIFKRLQYVLIMAWTLFIIFVWIAYILDKCFEISHLT